jgi:ABC-type transport system involved in cytochrome c biogenesis permease subunit
MHLALFLLQSNTLDPEQAQKIALAMMAVMPIFYVVIMAIIIIPFWFICKKAGFSPWLSLLNLIPLGSLILLYILAFAEWKVAPSVVPQLGYPYPPTPPQA